MEQEEVERKLAEKTATVENLGKDRKFWHPDTLMGSDIEHLLAVFEPFRDMVDQSHVWAFERMIETFNNETGYKTERIYGPTRPVDLSDHPDPSLLEIRKSLSIRKTLDRRAHVGKHGWMHVADRELAHSIVAMLAYVMKKAFPRMTIHIHVNINYSGWPIIRPDYFFNGENLRDHVDISDALFPDTNYHDIVFIDDAKAFAHLSRLFSSDFFGNIRLPALTFNLCDDDHWEDYNTMVVPLHKI